MGSKVWFLIFLISVLRNTSSVKLTNTQKQCYVHKKYYEDGATFQHRLEDSPCKFQCTCLVRKIEGIWAPTGSCVKSCKPMEYPYGCRPLSDGCCTTSYVCPGGEKCQDDKTGLMYNVGRSWDRKGYRSMCRCKCYGEGVGRYQCECEEDIVPTAIPLPTQRDFTTTETSTPPPESNCEMNDSDFCVTCPIGMKKCPIRAKCEKYDHTYKDVEMECVCNGRKGGTRCESKNRRRRISQMRTDEESMEHVAQHRARRSFNSKRIVEIYFSEAKRQIAESSTTEIYINARKL